MRSQNNPSDRSPPPVSPRAAVVVMALILASLGMLFLAGIAMYVLARIGIANPRPDQYGRIVIPPVPLGLIHVPLGLWLSTAVVMAGSLTIHKAVENVRREKLPALRQWVLATLLIAILFVALQCLFLRQLLTLSHGIAFYGLVFALILIHGLHVLGGVIAMLLVYQGARQNKYDHENYSSVRNAAMYWHFLDAVWIVMFVVFLAMR